MRSEVFDRVRHACGNITVFVGDERLSEGTGFAYTETREVFTAAHVVTGRWPIKHEDYKDPDQVIYCKFPNLPGKPRRNRRAIRSKMHFVEPTRSATAARLWTQICPKPAALSA